MIPAWALRLQWNMITKEARKMDLDPLLVASVIMAESGGLQFKSRFEPAYRWLVDVPYYARQGGISTVTERTHQMTSWGLMQIMGAVARERGYRGDLPELCIVRTGIHWGCKHLRMLLERFGHERPEDALAAYNGGPGAVKKRDDGTYPNQRYVTKVMRFYNELRGTDAD